MIAVLGAFYSWALPSLAFGRIGGTITDALDRFVSAVTSASPQLLTQMGADSGAQVQARSQLDDRSPAGVDRVRSILIELAATLDRHDPGKPPSPNWINHQSAKYLARTSLESFDYPYGDPYIGNAVPYVLSQMSGAYQSVPVFLATQHRVENRSDAEAYLDRLSAFAKRLDQETLRSRAHYAIGAAPPVFVLRRTIEQLDALIAPAPETSELVTSLVDRAATTEIPGDWRVRASLIVVREVRPALLRQRALLADALPRASDEAGVWRLPRGGDYYRFALRAATTTDMTPDEVHRLGRDRVAELGARADTVLRRLGATTGSVGARLSRMRRDPANFYANDDAGRARLIADANRMTGQIQQRIPLYFGHVPRAGVEIRRTPPAIEAGAPGGTYQTPSLDGSRPGLFSINLRDMAEWPKFDVPSFVYHEAVPGHHLQNAAMIEAPGIPTLRRLPLFSGYSEGWALYAEQLAYEMGVYADDPKGELGYLASMLFRAVRLVVDSGIHHMRWSRVQAIAYMIDALGDAETAVAREVDRYCVQPGQASSYMLGWQVWTESRTRAHSRLGDRFDIREFHDRGLLAGSLPLDVLRQLMDGWA